MSNDCPLVSIIIPVYNREDLVCDAIKSSICQTYPNIEVIIVDNKSTDNTWSVLQSWARKDERIKIFQNESNVGPVRNWKRCLEEARGEFCKILWSDDWMDSTFIEKAISIFDNETAFVLSWCSIVRSDGSKVSDYHFDNTSYKTGYYLKDILFYHDQNFPVSPGCALFRLDDLKKNLVISVPNLEQLDSSSNGAGNDLLLYLNTANAYDKVRIVPEFLNYFRHHESSISVASSNNIWRYYEWAMAYFIKSVYLMEIGLYKKWASYSFKDSVFHEYLGIPMYRGNAYKLSPSYIQYYVLTNTRNRYYLNLKENDKIKFGLFMVLVALYKRVRSQFAK